MPSPFPGMDPYLESPTVWGGVHLQFIAQIGATLNRIIPPRYVAEFGERVYVEQSSRDILPDIFVKKQRARQRNKANGGVATALADPPWEFELSPKEVRQPYVNIVDVESGKRIVTAIEVLSPTNKLKGTDGRRQYRKKQREVLRSRTHLLEIDLLRRGDHTVAIPGPRLEEWGDSDYLVCLSRGDQRRRRQVWRIFLRDRLPRVLVPLADKDPDVVLDLQAVFNTVYADGAYARKVDYRQEPLVSLSDEQEKWADRILRKRGLRS